MPHLVSISSLRLSSLAHSLGSISCTVQSDQLRSAVLSILQPQSTYYYRIAGEGPQRSDQLHSVVLSGLQPQSTYYYRIAGEGPERSFVTPPTDAAADVSIAVVGDIGLSKAARTTITRLSQQPHSLTLVPGDLSYANGFQSVWDRWQSLIEPDASTHPWMVVPGNHEAKALSAISPKGFEWPAFLKSSALLNSGAFLAYKKRWVMPSAASGSPSKLYYSFEVGGAHIIVLSCYSPFGPDSDQRKWLQKDLSSVDRSKTPWLIASLHEPWYHSNSDHQTDGQAMRTALEETLYAARVDMLITGHVHAYERTTRVYNGQEDPCGIMHITVGSGGKDLYPRCAGLYRQHVYTYSW
ncbi:unnamed protein product [Closterium sp. Naga37s-1]|nr:unnamed protein product [Closterium sp. Naga37s-1]